MTVTEADIQAIADTIVRNFNPDRVVLFGSHARGDAGPDSDIDLLVVLPFEGSPIPIAAKIRVALPHTIAFDIFARTPSQARAWSGDPIVTGALETGRVLFERAA